MQSVYFVTVRSSKISFKCKRLLFLASSSFLSQLVRFSHLPLAPVPDPILAHRGDIDALELQFMTLEEVNEENWLPKRGLVEQLLPLLDQLSHSALISLYFKLSHHKRYHFSSYFIL